LVRAGLDFLPSTDFDKLLVLMNAHRCEAQRSYSGVCRGDGVPPDGIMKALWQTQP
jgi:hypothetical protein